MIVKQDKLDRFIVCLLQQGTIVSLDVVVICVISFSNTKLWKTLPSSPEVTGFVKLPF